VNADASLPLDQWADAQARISSTKMANAISATSLVKHRPAFLQTVRPVKGSVLGAIGSTESDSEPDYFFHWLRDSAAVINAGLMLIGEGIDAEIWRQRYEDFIGFSRDLGRISGSRFLSEVDLSLITDPKARQFLRPEEEIAAVEGDALLGEARYNVDGTLDFLRWSRPQHDGPAARALACLYFLNNVPASREIREETAALLGADLGYTLTHAGAPCYDIWEEENAQHYYTLLVQGEALRKGAIWAERCTKNAPEAPLCREAAQHLEAELERFWSPEKGFLLSRIMPHGRTTSRELDFAVILGVLHSGRPDGPHSLTDPRVAATLAKLEDLFAKDYALNRKAGAALAFGRYKGDSYFSGGAYYFCTFGAAEFYYRLAAAKRDAGLIGKGDNILEMARRSIPASGEISEQFDQTTGEQTSAKCVTWGYAAFLTAWQARKDALAALANSAGARAE
jgi:glucoamylase